MEFKDQYKHPLWQKRRLDVLEKNGFECSCCGDSESQLHVHHRQYFKGRKVWEYADDELEVLCDSCHEEAHHTVDELKEVLSTLPLDGLREVAALVAGFRSYAFGPSGFDGGKTYNALFLSDPYAFRAGHIAALTMMLSDSTQDDLAEQLDVSLAGGRIDVLIPSRKKADA